MVWFGLWKDVLSMNEESHGGFLDYGLPELLGFQ